MSGQVTLENCTGSCCRNPFKVCFCKYACAHHVEQAKREAERQAWRDFVNGLTTAPGLTRKRNR